MRSRLAISALAIASLLGATAIVSAQTEPAKPGLGASTEGTSAGSTKAHHAKMKSKHVHMKPGTTTGMSTRSSATERSKPGGESTARKTPGN